MSSFTTATKSVVDGKSAIDVPKEILYHIFQFVGKPNDLYHIRLVHSVWNQIMDTSNNMFESKLFWVEKILQSTWILRHLENSNKRLIQPLNQGIVSNLLRSSPLIRSKSTTSTSLASSIVTKRNQLLNQWEGDNCIKYWTSNYSSNSDNIFQVNLQMNGSGLLILDSLLTTDPGALMSMEHAAELCKTLYHDIYCLQSMQNQLVQTHKPAREIHTMSWKDPSTASAVNSPLIPFVIPQGDSISISSLSQCLGVHSQLTKTTDRFFLKPIILDQISSSSPTPSTNTRTTHPLLDQTLPSIHFQDIFPKDQFNPEFTDHLRQWMTKYLVDPSVMILGLGQLNPLPIFIIGKSTHSSLAGCNLIGLMTSSFRAPSLDD